MSKYDFKVKWCPVCDQGWVGIVKQLNSIHLLLQCSECASQWDGFEALQVGIFMEEEVPVTKPHTEEIKKCGWENYILSE
jgi:hypothetical protein